MNKHELKFRVWDKQRKKYCYCDQLFFQSTCLSKLRSDKMSVWGQLLSPANKYDTSHESFANQDPENFVIEQFTGGYDLDNKPIFEGDKVVLRNNDVVFRVVKYLTGYSLTHKHLSSAKLDVFYKDNVEIGDIYNLTVIGNIHD